MVHGQKKEVKPQTLCYVYVHIPILDFSQTVL